MNYDVLSKQILDAAFSVHRELGPGLFENVYAICLAKELEDRGLETQREVTVPLKFKGKTLDAGYRADLLVKSVVLIELKSVEKLSAVHVAQVVTYLKLGRFPLGFLINFNSALLKDGIRRLENRDTINRNNVAASTPSW